MAVRMRRVESSAIEMLGYDAGDRVLAVRFTGGATYLYLDVPPYVYRELLEAESLGAFVNRQVKPHFRAREV